MKLIIITDCINYTQAKSKVPNMYIVGGIGFANRHKKQVFRIGQNSLEKKT